MQGSFSCSTISDHIILLQAASRPSQRRKEDILRTILQKTLDCSSLHLLTGMSYCSPQSSLIYTGSFFNPSSLYDSAALTPDTLSEPSWRRCLPIRNEETSLSGEAEAEHRCKQRSVLALLQNPSQKVKRNVHHTLRSQRKTKCTKTKGTVSCNSNYLTSGTPSRKVRETLTFLHPWK